MLNIRVRKSGKQQSRQQNKMFHGAVLLWACFASSTYAQSPALSPEQFFDFDPQKAEIGQLLFYDKILSGNKNISCGTCHHHDLGTADGLSLGIGEGGEGIGPDRTPGLGADRIRKRIPRNAPGLWNLGHRSITTMFHDGRLEVSDLYENDFNTPAEEWLPMGFNSPLAAQAVFPMVAQFEMSGNPRENEIAGAIHDRIDTAWPILSKRIQEIPTYRDMFIEAFDTVESEGDISIVEIANALSDFMNSEWQSYDSLYDQFLTDGTPLPETAERGRKLFFGTANCSQCHSGPLLSDQKFHALGLPPFGPGRTRRFDPIPRDIGRMGKSDDLDDMYRFRTPALRNVALTAPYGHNGAYPTLEGIVRHHLDPVAAREQWSIEVANLPKVPLLEEIDMVIQSDVREMARFESRLDIEPIALSDGEVADIVAFLNTLTETTKGPFELGRPESVPSGLPVD